MAEAVKKRENTLLASLFFSFWAPLGTGVALIIGRSITQMADFLRRSVEFLVLLLSWLVFRNLARKTDLTELEKARWEKIVSLSVATALGISGLVMFLLGLFRLRRFNQGGNVLPGLIIAGLGLAVNLFFWLRYRALGQEEENAIIEAQRQLYLAKILVDGCVISVLAVVALWPGSSAVRYIDSLGPLAVAFYLVWSALRKWREAQHVAGFN